MFIVLDYNWKGWQVKKKMGLVGEITLGIKIWEGIVRARFEVKQVEILSQILKATNVKNREMKILLAVSHFTRVLP